MDQDRYICFEDMVPRRLLRPDSQLPLTAAAIIGFARRLDPQPQHLGGVSVAPGDMGVFCASGWPQPTVVGDVLRIEVEVLAARLSSARPDKGRVTFRATMFAQRDEPVQYCTRTALHPLRMATA